MCWVMLILVWNNISYIYCSTFCFCEIINPASLSMANKYGFACCSVGHSQEETLKDSFEFHFLELLFCYEYNCLILLLLYPVILSKIFAKASRPSQE